MSTRWYYSEDGAQYGPEDESEIIRRIQAGELPPGTPVCIQGSMDWQPARNHACFQVEIYPQKQRPPGSAPGPDLSIDPALEQDLIRLAENPPQPAGGGGGRPASPTGFTPDPFQSPVAQQPAYGSGQPMAGGYGQAGAPYGVPTAEVHGLSDYEEAAVRSRHSILIGIALLFGAICPVITKNFLSGEYKFNFILLGPEGVESGVVIAQWLVLIAGAVILGLGDRRHDAYRGGVMVGLAGLNIILGFAIDDTFKKLSGDEASAGAIFGLGLVISWWGLMAGGRTRYLRPSSEAARVVGMIGGIVMLVLMLIPVLPEKAGSILIIMPFKAMGEGEDGTTAGLLILALLAMVITSAIMGIINSNQKTPERSSRLGQNSFQLASLIVPSIFVVVMVMMIKGMGEFPPLWVIINYLKIFCLLAGAIFLMPIGISECIAGARR